MEKSRQHTCSCSSTIPALHVHTHRQAIDMFVALVAWRPYSALNIALRCMQPQNQAVHFALMHSMQNTCVHHSSSSLSAGAGQCRTAGALRQARGGGPGRGLHGQRRVFCHAVRQRPLRAPGGRAHDCGRCQERERAAHGTDAAHAGAAQVYTPARLAGMSKWPRKWLQQ